MSQDAFGPNLRRIRLQRGISIEAIAEATRVSADLWNGLERNDLSRWPAGIFARAYIRQYAEAIGVDPDATVDEFCRCFARGDRRVARIVREQAAIVGHRLAWKDDLVGLTVRHNRRSTDAAETRDQEVPAFARRDQGRLTAALGDAAVVSTVGLMGAALLPVGRLAAIGVCGLLYHAVSLVLLGCTPSVWLLNTYIISRHPIAGDRRFLRLARNSVRVKV